MKKKPIAVFDIDGTYFRSSLLIELTRKLIEVGIFPQIAWQKVIPYYNKWLDRNHDDAYYEYIDAVMRSYKGHIRGVTQSDVILTSRLVMSEQSRRVYVFTRNLIQTLSASHTLIAISGSPEEVTQAFMQYQPFEITVGSKYEINGEGRYTGEWTLDVPKKKKDILEEIIAQNGFGLMGSVGVGDTESDIQFLELVERPICFNPNQKLLEEAKKRHWEIWVERKNVIYEIK